MAGRLLALKTDLARKPIQGRFERFEGSVAALERAERCLHKPFALILCVPVGFQIREHCHELFIGKDEQTFVTRDPDRLESQ